MSASDSSDTEVGWFEEEDVVIANGVRYDLSTEEGRRALDRACIAENENEVQPSDQKRKRLRYKQRAPQFDPQTN